MPADTLRVTYMEPDAFDAEAARLHARARQVEKDEQDEKEWAALARERDIEWTRNRHYRHLTSCAPRYKDAPHPDSYGADLPMRSGLRLAPTKEEKAVLAMRPIAVKLYAVEPLKKNPSKRERLKHEEQERKREKVRKSVSQLSLTILTEVN